jgi:hypothetical protein
VCKQPVISRQAHPAFGCSTQRKPVSFTVIMGLGGSKQEDSKKNDKHVRKIYIPVDGSVSSERAVRWVSAVQSLGGRASTLSSYTLYMFVCE